MEVAAAAVRTEEKHELVRQLQFPPGYRFVPTDEELVDVFLRGKIEGQKLPLDVVNEVSILNWQPGKLVEAYKGYGENRWFFFTLWEQSSSNKEKQPNRQVKVPGVRAAWKATGSVTPIAVKNGDGNESVVVGTKRVLIYNSSDPDEDSKWSMHEYILKEYAAIGQYVLCSIQRKQHSDTVDKQAGEGSSSTSKKNKASDDIMDPEKKTNKKRRMTEKQPCTEPEGPTETTLIAEAPLKLTRKTTKAQKTRESKKPLVQAEGPMKPTRKQTKSQTKKQKISMQAEGEQQQQQQQQGKSPVEPVMPPKKDQLGSQQEQHQLLAAAAGALPVHSAVSVQACVCPPPNQDGMLGASAPMLEEEGDDIDMSMFLAQPNDPCTTMFYNQQKEQSWSLSDLTGNTALLSSSPDASIVEFGTPLLYFYPQQQQEKEGYDGLFGVQQNQYDVSLGGSSSSQSLWMGQSSQHTDLSLFPGNTTQLNSSAWKHGHHQHQNYCPQAKENNGGSFGVQDQQHMNPPQDYYILPLDEGYAGLLPLDVQLSSSDDLPVDNLFAHSGQSDNASTAPPSQGDGLDALFAWGTPDERGNLVNPQLREQAPVI